MLSTLSPVTCCMLQRLGSGFGQNGSTRVLRRAVRIHCLSGDCLRADDCPCGKREGGSNDEGRGV